MTPFHIEEDDMVRFHENRMTEKQEFDFLTHIGSCTSCAERFSRSFQNQLRKAPENLKERILTNATAITPPKCPLRPYSRKKQLLWYSTRVGVSVCGALLLLMSISLDTDIRAKTYENQETSYFVSDTGHFYSLEASLDQILQKINSQIHLQLEHWGSGPGKNQEP